MEKAVEVGDTVVRFGSANAASSTEGKKKSGDDLYSARQLHHNAKGIYAYRSVENRES